MKKLFIISALAITTAAFMTSCRSKQDTGRTYMPDMAYSRAYETYAELDSQAFTGTRNDPQHRIYYNARPVDGTIKRGELFPFTPTNDSAGVKMADAIKANPIAPLNEVDMKEAGRQYNIYCGVCHGAKGEGNGPLATSGKVGGIKSLLTDVAKGYSDGRLFHIISYGQNLMGGYASQLNREQRWKVIQYVRTLQGPATTAASAPAPVADTASQQNTKL